MRSYGNGGTALKQSLSNAHQQRQPAACSAVDCQGLLAWGRTRCSGAPNAMWSPGKAGNAVQCRRDSIKVKTAEQMSQLLAAAALKGNHSAQSGTTATPDSCQLIPRAARPVNKASPTPGGAEAEGPSTHHSIPPPCCSIGCQLHG
jgi:hypothetical protein